MVRIRQEQPKQIKETAKETREYSDKYINQCINIFGV